MSGSDGPVGVSFALPQRRKDAYVARMRTTGGNKAVTVKIAQCQVVSVKAVRGASGDGDGGDGDGRASGAGGAGGGGYVVKLLLPADSPTTEHLLAIDAEAQRAGAERNGAWFRNNLTADDMRALFRPAIGPAAGGGARPIAVLASDVKEPRPLALDGAELDGAAALAELATGAQGRAALRACQATCVLEAQGLYFYARRFGVRWRLRSLTLTSPAVAAEEAAAAAALNDDDRRGIEAQWAAEIAAFGARLDAQAAALAARKAEVAELLAAAAALPAAEKEWNATLEALRRSIYGAGGGAPGGGAPGARVPGAQSEYYLRSE